MKKISCVCLAAGRSSRMKGDHKLLKKLGGKAVIEHIAAELSQLDCAEVLLITGDETPAISRLVEGSALKIVENPDAALGMHSSIRAAIHSLARESQAMLICLADQPFQLKERLENLLKGQALSEDVLLRSIVGQEPGHPVLIGRRYFSRILEQPDGDYGCSYLFKEYPFRSVAQPESALWDLDTAEDFLRLAKHAPS